MPFELTSDQRIFINLYARQYAQIQEQISRLQDQISRLIPISNELRHNIHSIYADVSHAENRRHITPPPPPISSEEPPATYTMSYTFMDEPLLSQANSNLMTTETTSRTFSDIETPLNTECPIRLEPFEPNSQVVQINRCGHIFYPAGLQHWFNTNTRCPFCRTELRPNQPSQSSDHLLTTLLYDLFFPSTTDISNNVFQRRTRRNAR